MVQKILRLREAAELLCGGITERTLRAEVHAGRLAVVRLGGKFLVTQQQLDDMIAAATTRLPCPADDSLHASTSDQPEPTAEPPGSFSTERVRLAQAQALMTVERLKEPSNGISPEPTDHRVVPIGRRNSSAPR